MLALGRCTVCGRLYEPATGADGRGVQVATVAFDGGGAAPAAEKKPARKRWAVLTSKRGRTYYHNTETGEDRWDKPADLEADAVEDAFGTREAAATGLPEVQHITDRAVLWLMCAVPFKNDAVKKALLREQMKLEAAKMGVPLEVVAATQQQLQQQDQADDPLAKMVGRGGSAKSKSPPPARAASPRKAVPPAQQEQQEEEEQEEKEDDATQQTQDAAKAGGGSCVVM
ncbi:unnamed protein product [Phytophthora lilii]|uniref:Unnamed protein product n=1 Tax=Phytophthora lilii TaxID=2077276 RepID=A0A9W6WRC8_9STRA|nr:unnamed protein product [Phytophthora lilii]